MSEEIIIINNEPFYRIPNGTSYDYAHIPKEFKPYFEKIQQENKKLKIEISARETVCDELQERINKAIEHISNEFLCYDNESDEYIQGLKTIDLLKGDKE